MMIHIDHLQHLKKISFILKFYCCCATFQHKSWNPSLLLYILFLHLWTTKIHPTIQQFQNNRFYTINFSHFMRKDFYYSQCRIQNRTQANSYWTTKVLYLYFSKLPKNTTFKLSNTLNTKTKNLRDSTHMLDTYERNPPNSPFTILTHNFDCHDRTFKLLQTLDKDSHRNNFFHSSNLHYTNIQVIQISWTFGTPGHWSHQSILYPKNNIKKNSYSYNVFCYGVWYEFFTSN